MRSAGARPAKKCPPISATKALTGHLPGVVGVQEAIYLLMMNNGFICESAHITELDPVFADMPIVQAHRQRQTRNRAELLRLAAPTPPWCSSGWTREIYFNLAPLFAGRGSGLSVW
jgi:hypothetical protein